VAHSATPPPSPLYRWDDEDDKYDSCSNAEGGSKPDDDDDAARRRSGTVRTVKRYNVLGVRFDVDAHYSLIDVVGQGAYGVVCAAYDETQARSVAIKKVRPSTNSPSLHLLYAACCPVAGAFLPSSAKNRAAGPSGYCSRRPPRPAGPLAQPLAPSPLSPLRRAQISNAFEHVTYTKRTLREVRLLRLLKHDNLIGVLTLLPPLRSDGFKDLYIVCDLMETDLSSIIKSPQELSDDHIQFFIYQVLRGLKFLHTAQVVHRDMKPRNLLVNSNCDLKICDFGLARIEFGCGSPGSGVKVAAMTDYVATRWYRAPEILLGWGRYGRPVDMWAVGCVLAELLGRKPLFPGTDSHHQLAIISECLGKPGNQLLQEIDCEDMRGWVDELPDRDRIPLDELFPRANLDACTMLEGMLDLNPETRMTVEEALAHPYLTNLHFPDDEPEGPVLAAADFDFERAVLTGDELKDEILQEIRLYHQHSPLGAARETFEAAQMSEAKPEADEAKSEPLGG